MNDIPLAMLESGEWAEVTDVSGNPNIVSRLSELGVMSGCKLCMLQQGQTCLLKVGESRLSLGCMYSDCTIMVRLVI